MSENKIVVFKAAPHKGILFQNKLYIFILIFFATAAIYIFISFINNGGNVRDNIYPELIGFSLEGIAFVVILNIYEKSQLRKQENNFKENLKNSLRFFLENLLHWIYQSLSDQEREQLGFEEALYRPEGVKKLSDLLNKSNKKFNIVEQYFKFTSKRNLPLMESLLPIAAQIGKEHLMIWASMINNIREIATTNDKIDSMLVRNLLNDISIFDSYKIRDSV